MSELHPAADSRKPGVLQRQSNFELLRIIAMLMIVMHHFAYHGKFSFPGEETTFNELWTQFILVGGKVGTDIFVLISGYFLISSKAAKTSKILKLWGQIFFYSMGFYAAFMLIGQEEFDINIFFKHITPVTWRLWWFASAYFLLYMLSPYLNILLQHLEQKQHLGLMILMLLCWCLIPTVTAQKFLSNDLVWFVTLYTIGSYFKLYGTPAKPSAPVLLLMSALMMIVIFLTAPALEKLAPAITFMKIQSNFFYDMQAVTVLIASLLLFLGFAKIRMRSSKVINVISSATFGVYLIHEHDYVRPFIWRTLFKNAAFSESKYLVPYSLLVTAAVFLGCTLIELIRIYVLEKPCMLLINKIGEWFDTKCKPALLTRLTRDRER